MNLHQCNHIKFELARSKNDHICNHSGHCLKAWDAARNLMEADALQIRYTGTQGYGVVQVINAIESSPVVFVILFLLMERASVSLSSATTAGFLLLAALWKQKTSNVFSSYTLGFSISTNSNTPPTQHFFFYFCQQVLQVEDETVPSMSYLMS